MGAEVSVTLPERLTGRKMMLFFARRLECEQSLVLPDTPLMITDRFV